MVVRAFALGVAAVGVAHGAAQAQQRDTTRTRRDTVRAEQLPVRDTMPARDTSGAVRIPVPAGPDSLLQRDSLLRRDSLRVERRDTLKAPIAAAEAPVLADPTGSFVWDRRDLFGTGALTAQDLLDRVVGVTGLRGGWIAQPMVSAYLGDPRRVRIWLDGLELTESDPRSGGVWDLTQIPLWALDDLRVERSASEVRVHLRSWRVQRTTPFTRTDVYTGDQGTNLYRGLFGRRYGRGEALQVAGQQYGTSPGRNSASSDAFGALGRIGWARGPWSADAFLLRLDRNRGRTAAFIGSDSIPAIESTRSEAYARLGWGRTDSTGAWAQVIANTSRYAYGGSGATSAGTGVVVDTARSQAQYVVAAGYRVGHLRASATQRLVVGASRRIATPTFRAGYEGERISLSAFAEGRGPDSTRRADVSAVVRPLGFVFVSGSYGTELHRDVANAPVVSSDFLRGEGGVRLGQLWLSAGMLRRDRVLLDAPRILAPNADAVADDAADALFATVRGRLWKAVYADLQATQWSDSGGYYRPKHQTRSELYVSTRMLDRFPSGNLHILASASHEYRSATLWPVNGGTVRIPGYRTLSTLIQVRIIEAEVFWNFRNVLGERYEEIPGGFRMPRLVNIYGVRWEFWN
jgi:hypothetical protein